MVHGFPRGNGGVNQRVESRGAGAICACHAEFLLGHAKRVPVRRMEAYERAFERGHELIKGGFAQEERTVARLQQDKGVSRGHFLKVSFHLGRLELKLAGELLGGEGHVMHADGRIHGGRLVSRLKRGEQIGLGGLQRAAPSWAGKQHHAATGYVHGEQVRRTNRSP